MRSETGTLCSPGCCPKSLPNPEMSKAKYNDRRIARTAIENGAAFLALSCLDEGMALRQRGIRSRLLLLGERQEAELPWCIEQQLTCCVNDRSGIENLADRKRFKYNQIVGFRTNNFSVGIEETDGSDSIERSISGPRNVERTNNFLGVRCHTQIRRGYTGGNLPLPKVDRYAYGIRKDNSCFRFLGGPRSLFYSTTNFRRDNHPGPILALSGRRGRTRG